MVIQRNWKIASNTTENTQSANNNNSSSDDSNSSWKTNSTVTMAPKSAVATNTVGAISNNTVTTVTATVVNIMKKHILQRLHVYISKQKSHISNPQMAESVHRALKNRLNGRSHANQTNAEAAARSMELMRVNIQEVFNQEVSAIINKYIEVKSCLCLNCIVCNL